MKAAALLLACVLALVALAPVIAPYDPMHADSSAVLQPPSQAHLFGTDRLGRDVMSRLLFGGQRTLATAALAALIALLGGISLGILGASYRALAGLIDALTNALLAFPGLLLALVAVTLLGVSAVSVALAVGFALVPQVTRVTSAAIRVILATPYVGAARALGAGEARIMLRHVLPNVAPTLLAFAAVTFGYSLLNTAALSFLGLSGDLGLPDWGAMLFEGRVTFRTAPWVSIAPGVAITAVVMAVNALANHAEVSF